MRPLRLLFLPFVPFYAMVIWIRNLLFDHHFLRVQKSQTPTICVGNICIGGSGKTPHIEYLVRLLKGDFKVCTLSRGYGRKSKGFVLAKDHADSDLLGDESLQYFQKFPDIRVCVDINRCSAIRRLKADAPEIETFLLDDAYQYRAIKAGLTILLTDYFRPYYNDYLLPVGNLREPRNTAQRADIIVVTKCPTLLSPIVRESILEELKPQNRQSVYFSYLKHGSLYHLDGTVCELGKDVYIHFTVLSGIYNPYPLVDHLRNFTKDIKLFQFSDHHNFTKSELKRVRKHFLDYFCNHKYIVTTEKDLMRLKDSPAFEEISDLPICYVPIEVGFHHGDQAQFDLQILEFVKKNKR